MDLFYPRRATPERSTPARRAEKFWRGENSYLFDFFFAEQAGWFHEQNQNQNGERDGVAVGRGDVAGHERLGDADDDAAERRTGQVADAAQHRRDERLESRQNSHEWINGRIIDGPQNSRRRREHRAEREGERNDDIGVHAHERGGFGIERDGAHGGADLGFQNNEPQREQQQQRHGDKDDLVAVEAQFAKFCDGINGKDFWKFFRRGTEGELAGVFEKKRNADGGDQHREFWLFP